MEPAAPSPQPPPAVGSTEEWLRELASPSPVAPERPEPPAPASPAPEWPESPAPPPPPPVRPAPLPPPPPVRPAPPAPPPAQRNLLVELTRVGSGVVAPSDTAGLLLIVRTPRRVRRGQVFSLREARTVVGRGAKVGCLLDDSSVEEYHAVVSYERHEDEAAFFLHPISTRGAQLNGTPVESAGSRLRSGDRIGLGDTELVFFQADLGRSEG